MRRNENSEKYFTLKTYLQRHSESAKSECPKIFKKRVNINIFYNKDFLRYMLFGYLNRFSYFEKKNRFLFLKLQKKEFFERGYRKGIFLYG